MEELSKADIVAVMKLAANTKTPDEANLVGQIFMLELLCDIRDRLPPPKKVGAVFPKSAPIPKVNPT